ncbi:MAG TPA: nitrilase-related carbon-nitrogen hydrolase [Pirellulales bacterium]
MSEVVRVAGVQMNVAFAQVAENLAKIEASIRKAAAGGAKLVVFPECALTGYCFETRDEAFPHSQPVPGPATDRLAAVCRETDAYAVVGMLERDGERIFNAAAVVGPQGVVGVYRKIHLPYLGVDRFVTPGDRLPEVYQCGALRVAVNICYDGSFPEISRAVALDGADVIALPTNWPTGGETAADWLPNARALENHVYYLTVDRVGEERGFKFIGKSRLADPRGGDVVPQQSRDEEVLFFGDLILAIPRNKHLVRVPGKHEIHRFRDRRPEMYGRLMQKETPSEGTSGADRESSGFPPANCDESPLYQQLWAPWRMNYIQPEPVKFRPALAPRENETSVSSRAEPETCFLCRAAMSNDDRANLVVERGKRTFTVLNRYPYNNGHLLIATLAHKATPLDLTAEEHLECMQSVSRMTELMTALMNCDGFNIGLNVGRAAGAGVPGHIHWHIVPRWNGDANFMPVLSGIRVIPQSLDALWELLTTALKSAT